jgi:hypothetical protein
VTQSGHQHAVPPNPDLRTWARIDCEVNWHAGFESRDVRGIAAEGLSEADHSRTPLRAAEHVCLAVQSGVNKSLTEPGAGLWGLVLLAFALVISWSCG